MMPFNDYIIDFAYIPEDDSVVAIEVNPFNPGTGAGMFDWNDDLGILEGKGIVDEGLEKNADKVVLRIRQDNQVDYSDQWFNYLSYKLEDYCNGYSFYDNIKLFD